MNPALRVRFAPFDGGVLQKEMAQYERCTAQRVLTKETKKFQTITEVVLGSCGLSNQFGYAYDRILRLRYLV